MTLDQQTSISSGSAGLLLLIWPTTAFWIPVKPLQLRSMLRKSMRCTENCNACSQHCSTERAQFFSTQPYILQPTLQKLNKLGCEVLPHLPYSLTSRQPTTMSSSVSETFCRENTSTTRRKQKMLSKSSSNPEAQIFIPYRNEQTYCNGSCFD